MKKLLCTALLLTSLWTMASCGGDQRLNVGIIQYATHDALDKARLGFVDGLNELGVDDSVVKITVQNANGESSTLSSISSSMARKSDLILAIATPAAVSAKSALENANKTTPLLFTAVTDAVSANLIESNEHPGGHITGTLDINPVAEQIGLFHELDPNISKIGMLYTSSESNSAFQIDLAKAACDNLGIEYVVRTITNATDIPSIVSNLVNENIQGLYVPTDNVVATAMSVVNNAAKESGIPIIAGETSMVENGALITYGLDYYALGKRTAQMAKQILIDKVAPSDIPTVGLDEFPLILNLNVARDFGITVPQALIDRATVIYDDEE